MAEVIGVTKEYVDGKYRDLQNQLADIRTNTSPFNIEELRVQVRSLDDRTLKFSDRIKYLEDKMKELPAAIEAARKVIADLEVEAKELAKDIDTVKPQPKAKPKAKAASVPKITPKASQAAK